MKEAASNLFNFGGRQQTTNADQRRFASPEPCSPPKRSIHNTKQTTGHSPPSMPFYTRKEELYDDIESGMAQIELPTFSTATPADSAARNRKSATKLSQAKKVVQIAALPMIDPLNLSNPVNGGATIATGLPQSASKGRNNKPSRIDFD